MHLRPLGHSSLQLSPIGLGCWQFAEGKALTGPYWPKLSPEVTQDIVKVSLEDGINWFDTAEAYGWGASESGLAKALYACGKQAGTVQIATKWFPILRFASSITKTITKRLQYLDGFPIDLYQIHAPFGSFSSLKRQMDAMAELMQSQKIGAIGVSNFNAKQLKLAFEHLEKKGIPLASNQIQYNLLQRQAEQNGVIGQAKALGVSIIAYSPLAQGLLTGKYHEDEERIQQTVGPRKRKKSFSRKGLTKSAPLIATLKGIAENRNLTPAQIALRWVLDKHEELILAIPGATKVSHAQQNAAVLHCKLIPEEISLLDKKSSEIS